MGILPRYITIEIGDNDGYGDYSFLLEGLIWNGTDWIRTTHYPLPNVITVHEIDAEIFDFNPSNFRYDPGHWEYIIIWVWEWDSLDVTVDNTGDMSTAFKVYSINLAPWYVCENENIADLIISKDLDVGESSSVEFTVRAGALASSPTTVTFQIRDSSGIYVLDEYSETVTYS